MRLRAVGLTARVLLVLGLLLEVTDLWYAHRALVRARLLNQQIEDFQPGITSRSQVFERLQRTALPLNNLPCSGDGCTGVGIAVINYPTFMIWQRLAVDRLLAQLSLVRPAAFSAGFYFKDDVLQEIMLTLVRDGARVRFDHSDPDGDTSLVSNWHVDRESKVVTGISVGVIGNKGSSDRPFTSALMLDCLSAMNGCEVATELWPNAPKATSKR